MEEDRSNKIIEHNNLVNIASIMHGSKLDEHIFDRVINSLCDLIQAKYGSMQGMVPGILNHPLSGSRKQNITIWGPGYAGNLEVFMPSLFESSGDKFKLKDIQVRYRFNGAIENERCEECGGIFFSAKEEYIFDFIEGLGSALRKEVSKTNAYLCLMLTCENLRSDKETKIIPGARAYLIKEDGSSLNLDSNKVAGYMSEGGKTVLSEDLVEFGAVNS